VGWEMRGRFAHPPARILHTLSMTLKDRVITPYVKFFAKHYYPILTRISGDDLVFINWGYEEDPPMALPLDGSDESNRFPIQLYHRTATQVDFKGKKVLEVSCGHGGGASYLVRALAPASYTGLDSNSAGVDSCRRRHQLRGLDFVQGNAESLPFPDQSFDEVLNIQSSHCYPQFPRFLNEVTRVLRPGGHFLYADARRADAVAKWDEDLGDASMRLMSERDINEEVARAVAKNVPQSLKLVSRVAPASFVDKLNGGLCRSLSSGKFSYRMYCFANE
jgi:ubiquinone/menaquinone biosynthesis C-methylase UbiE